LSFRCHSFSRKCARGFTRRGAIDHEPPQTKASWHGDALRDAYRLGRLFARARLIESQEKSALFHNAINYPFDEPLFLAAWAIGELGDGYRTPVRQ
jgi:hypothetical protein